MAAASAAAAASAGAGPSSAGSLEAVLPPWFATEVAGWLRDDAPTFDIGGYVVGDSVEEAALLAKTPCVVAGVPWVNAVFAQLDCTVEWAVAEGDVIAAVPARVATVRGACRKLLLGERTALNIISRASGIATAARELAAAARAAGWRGEVAGTRKLTPGFRLVEKYALLVGGVSTHRMDLSSMVMLKDNHVWAAGSITAAVAAARRAGGFSIKIEVEARNLEEAFEAAAAGADIVMFDNYKPAALAVDTQAFKARFPGVVTEASGGVSKTTLPSYCLPHVDVISMGSLTHGYGVSDFSLKILKGAGAAAVASTLAAAPAAAPPST